MFLALPMVKQHHLVPLYFRDKAHGKTSEQSVEKLLRFSGTEVRTSVEKPWEMDNVLTDANTNSEHSSGEQVLSQPEPELVGNVLDGGNKIGNRQPGEPSSVKTKNLVLDMVRSGSSVEELKEEDKVNLPDDIEIKYGKIVEEHKGEKPKLLGTHKPS